MAMAELIAVGVITLGVEVAVAREFVVLVDTSASYPMESSQMTSLGVSLLGLIGCLISVGTGFLVIGCEHMPEMGHRHRILARLRTHSSVLINYGSFVKLWRGQKESVPAVPSNAAKKADCCNDGQTSRLTPSASTARHRLLAVLCDWSIRPVRLTATKGAPLYARNRSTTSNETVRSKSASERVRLPRGDDRRPAGEFLLHADRRVQSRFAITDAAWGRC
jgi:hypothetical protein